VKKILGINRGSTGGKIQVEKLRIPKPPREEQKTNNRKEER